MKSLFTSCLVFCLSLFSYSQCDAPIVASWFAPTADNATINFTVPEGAESYHFLVFGEYGWMDFGGQSTATFDGSTTEGLNTVELDLTEMFDFLPSDYFYYSIELSITCSNSEQSEVNKFYISPFSMRNDPELDLGEYFLQPFTYFPDTVEIGHDSHVVVAEGENTEMIDSLSVFVDIGHTYIGDLSIDLISPSGTIINLFDGPNEFNDNNNISVVFKDGEEPLPIGGSNIQGFYSPSESFSELVGEVASGVWIIRVSDNVIVDDGMVFGISLMINSSPCLSSVSGNVYFDSNNNQFQDAEEPVYPWGIIENSLDNQSILSNNVGYYIECSDLGNGTLTLINTPDYYTSTPLSFEVNDGDYLSMLNFPLVPIADIEDLQVDLFTLTPDRPGFDNTYIVNYENVGTECIDNVVVTVEMDGPFDILNSDPDPTSQTDNTATFNIGQLCPLQSGSINLNVLLNDTVSIGSIMESTATINPIAGDEVEHDNVSIVHSTVVGSFDPNDKQVNFTSINPEFLADNTKLKYTVRFQNTGTYYAERVMIVDTLSNNLDPNTLMITANSHPVEVTKSGNVFYFEFDQIFLPDSTADEPGSHGYIRYDVQPYDGLQDGESIENTAYIFFDFNAPIITNTTNTIMEFVLGLPSFNFEAGIYPNPATNILTVEWPEAAGVLYLEVYDISGKILHNENVINKQRLQMEISNYPSGIYLIRFIGDTTIKPLMWTKM